MRGWAFTGGMSAAAMIVSINAGDIVEIILFAALTLVCWRESWSPKP